MESKQFLKLRTLIYNLYLIRQRYKGTVVNRTLPSLHEGLLNITVP